LQCITTRWLGFLERNNTAVFCSSFSFQLDSTQQLQTCQVHVEALVQKKQAAQNRLQKPKG